MHIVESIRRKTTCNAALRWATWRTKSSGLLGLLEGMGNTAIKPQFYDAWNLYRNVRSRQPGHILEFGVGVSTVVMAEALHRNGGGRLTTVDASERWLGEMERSLPQHLRPYVALHYSPLAIMSHAGDPCHRYTDVPGGPIDLLYLDGPDGADVPGWGVGNDQVAADPVLMEGQFTPSFRMIVDTRVRNIAFLRKHLTRRYRYRYHDIFKVGTFDLVT